MGAMVGRSPDMKRPTPNARPWYTPCSEKKYGERRRGHVQKVSTGWCSVRTRPRSPTGEWWLAGDAKPWQPEAVTVVSDRLIFRPRTALW